MDATLRHGRSDPVTFAGGRYVVRRLLGEGSQKVVYLVHDASAGCERALSLIKLGAVADEDVQRLHREAEAMARLGAQAHVVTLFDIGEEHGRPYLVSEFVAGGDLRAELRSAGGPLPLERAIDIALDIADGLVAAHAQGIVHRDIKPANIWLSDGGNAKLGDFGLAYALDRSRLTMTGAMLGTAAYMPPEQALGQQVDERSDLYALGSVLYEMIAGRPPFVGDDALAIVSQHIHSAPVAPSWHNARAAGALEALVLRLLAKVPARRPADAATVVEELRSIRESPFDAAAPPIDDLQGLGWGRFVGRDAEMERLKEALDGAFSQAGSTVMLVGEPGIGKTRLAEEFAVFATLRGARLLRGRFVETEFASPYGAFVEALSEYVDDRPDAALRDELLDDAPQIAQLLPSLRDRFADIAPPPAVEGEEGRAVLLQAVTSVLARAAQAAPIVMILDDLHWADRPSLMMLERIVRAAKETRILLVGIYRDVELDRTHPLSGVAAGLRRDGVTHRMLLRGLSEESMSEMLDVVQQAAVDGSTTRAALAEVIYRETEGNPLFVREVLSHLVEEGKVYRENNRWRVTAVSATELGIPEGVRDVIGRRLSRLSDGCSRILARVCAMPGGFSWGELRAISREEDDALVDHIDEALSAQMIVEKRGRADDAYDFTHALIRSTLYDELTPPRRLLLHRQIGQALETLYASDIEPRLAMLAHHYFRAAAPGSADKAIEFSRRAAEQAGASFAYEDAAAHFDRALQSLDLVTDPDAQVRCDLLLGKGESQWQSGDMTSSHDTLEAAASVAREIGAADKFARAAMAYGGKMFLGYYEGDREIQLLDEGLELVGDANPLLRAELLARLAMALQGAEGAEGSEQITPEIWHDRTLRRRDEVAVEAVELARSNGDPAVTAYALHAWQLTHASSPDVNFKLAAAEEMLALGRSVGDIMLEHSALAWQLHALLVAGDLERATESIDAYVEIAEKLRMPQKRWFAARLRVLLPSLQGQFEEAERLAVEALKIGRAHGGGTAIGVFGYQVFAIRWNQGRLEELRPGLEQYATGAAQDMGTYSMLAAAAEQGDDMDAVRRYYEWFSSVPEGAVLHFLENCLMLTRPVIALRDERMMRKIYEAILPYRNQMAILGVMPPENCFGACSQFLALLEAGLGLNDAARQSFDEALALLERMHARPWLARAQLDCADLLMREGAPSDQPRASELLQSAHAIASEIGMRTVLRRARELLEQAR